MMTMKECAAKYGDWGYAIARIGIGALFLWHGLNKFGIGSQMNPAGFSAFAGVPVWLGTLAAVFEVAAGLGLLLGLFTRYAAKLGAIVMVAAWLLVHWKLGANTLNPFANGGELALVYFLFFLVAFKLGNGKLSLEQALFKKER